MMEVAESDWKLGNSKDDVAGKNPLNLAAVGVINQAGCWVVVRLVLQAVGSMEMFGQ